MWSGCRALLAAAAAVLLLAQVSTDVTFESTDSLIDNDENADDDELDTAPFMVVVTHADGARCGGSLLSLRTVLTTATCARARLSPADDLIVLAAATAHQARSARGSDGVRRVVRLAVAGTQHDAPPVDLHEDAWRGALLDLAVLELEAPFGSSAGARPILTASKPTECDGEALVCHVVRAEGRALLVAAVSPAPPERCAAAARHWPVVRDHAYCLFGPRLCPEDRGAGVVCGGKLCGVLSRSAGAGDCGDTHAAQSVPRWRRFLHCAHTLRACGRGDCKDMCTERLLAEGDADVDGEQSSQPDALAPSQEATTSETELTPEVELEESDAHPSATPAATNTTASVPASASKVPVGAVTELAPLLSSRPAHEFEPNRADFRAGEYGDNAAEYGGEDVGVGPTRTTSPSSPPDRSHMAPLDSLVQDPSASVAPNAPGGSRRNSAPPVERRVDGDDTELSISHITHVNNCMLLIFLLNMIF